MGVFGSREFRKEDRMLEQNGLFVRHAMLGELESVQTMVKKKQVKVDAQDRFGMTALHWAAYTGKMAVVEELLRMGASPSVHDENGRNALHHACRKDHVEMVRYLVTVVGIDINSTSENKETPLHKAVRGRCIKTVEVLLQLGANPSLRNDVNRTPLEETKFALEANQEAAKDHSNNEKKCWMPETPTQRSPSSKTFIVSMSENNSMTNKVTFQSAGKRVIMALRVNKVLSGKEKLEIIQRQLEKHAT